MASKIQKQKNLKVVKTSFLCPSAFEAFLGQIVVIFMTFSRRTKVVKKKKVVKRGQAYYAQNYAHFRLGFTTK